MFITARRPFIPFGERLVPKPSPGVGRTVVLAMTATATMIPQTDAVSKLTPRIVPSPRKALIVEDRPCLAMLLGQILARLGIDAEVLRNGADALVRLKNGAADFDLVCSDVELRGASGWTILERVHACCPGLPFMLISGDPSESFSREASRRGAVPAFRKPFKLAEVQRTLAGLLS